MSEVILLVGFPASGKSTIAKQYISKGYSYINRDSLGGKVSAKVPMMMNELAVGCNVLLDNTFPDAESRKPFIDGAKKAGATIKCLQMETSIEDAQFNAALRMYQRKGKLLGPDDYKGEKDPNIFPPVVLFGYKKKFEQPTLAEGFDTVEKVPFVRKKDPTYKNKAIILDYDQTLRECVGGNGKYPISEDQIKIMPNRIETILSYKEQGYLILGVSNQSGIGKGELTDEQAIKLFDYTNKLLGINIDYRFCPHAKFPIACYCRKPMSGLGAVLIEDHKLDPNKSIFVGDMTTDKTFARRCGFQYIDQTKFFK